MIKHRRIVYFGLATLLLGACVGMNRGAYGAANLTDHATIRKHYELTDDVGYVEFRIEGNRGEFTASMMLPDGHVVKGVRSSTFVKAGIEQWGVSFVVNRPAQGRYSFEIHAERGGYYNLSAEVPLFGDIAGHWARADISDFAQRGIVGGYGNGNFGPDDSVTGEALIKMMVLALTEEQPHGNRQWGRLFRWKVLQEDVSVEMGKQDYKFEQAAGADWPRAYVAAANDLGILKDWKDDSLKQPFARRDVALMIANVMSLVEDKAVAPRRYSDTSSLSEDMQEAISRASAYAIFAGYPDGSFQPNRVVTRAEAVKVLARLAAYLNR